MHSSETGEGFEVGADVERFSSRAKSKALKLLKINSNRFEISKKSNIKSSENVQDQGMSCPPSTERPPPLGANSRQPSKLSLDLLQVTFSFDTIS